MMDVFDPPFIPILLKGKPSFEVERVLVSIVQVLLLKFLHRNLLFLICSLKLYLFGVNADIIPKTQPH